jgi:phosphocarrier protein HPr
MSTRTVTVGSTVGLHARPAALFTQAVAAAGVPVTIAREGGDPVNAASILAVLSLGVEHGDTVVLVTESDDEVLLDSLEELLATDHDAAAS